MFKENVRLNEALKYHIKEAQQLQKLTASLEKEKTSLALDKVCLKDGTANSGVTGSLWIETIHLHTQKKSLSNFFPPSCNTCQSRAGYISGASSRPLCYLLVLILCILLVVLSPTPTPRLLPTSQWSVVSVSFHWCVGSNLVNPPAPISLKQTNTGHINLTAADSTTGG